MRDGPAAAGADLVDDPLGGAGRGAAAGRGDTQVVDHDPGAFGGESQGVGAAETTAGSGDGGDPARTDSLRHR
ncbi:hypothetical protein SSP35_17_01140 [Streptomyces sp. NBRC 110611]|nr:hypothetical protein SSP35_17_01140 [Streptomyces sp. NBRC 110611]